MEIVRKRLSAQELYDPRITYDDETDTIYYTPPGETVGIESPEFDPRHTGSIPLPAGAGTACDSAATMVAMLQAMADALIANIASGQSALVITLAIIAFLVAMGWVALFILIIEALVAAAIFAGAAALEEAFTPEMWDTLNCIIFCEMSAGGHLTAGALEAIRTEVDAQIGGIAATLLNYWFDALGEAGLNNASLVMGGLVTGDCADCECEWCYEWSNVTDFAADGWSRAINTPASKYWTYAPATLAVKQVTAAWTSTGNSGHASSAFSLWELNIADMFYLATPLNTANPHTWSNATAQVCGSLTIGVNTPDGVTELGSVLIVGVGTMPAWTHGAEC